MSDRLNPHHPTKATVKTLEGLDVQRIYDQRVMQDEITKIFDQLADLPFLNATFIEDVALSTTEVLVEHKLGRKPRGYIIARYNANKNVYDNLDTSTADLTLYLPLVASGTVTVNLIIF